MGHLTDDITRLCGEILALRNSRETLVRELTRGTMDMKKAVSAMRTRFRDAHAEMTRKTKAERAAFKTGLRNNVAGLRNEFAADIAGARRAWFGPTLAERKARELEEQRRVEAEARRRKEEEERKAREEEEARRGEVEALAKARAEEEQKRQEAEVGRIKEEEEEEHQAKAEGEQLGEGKAEVKGEAEEPEETEEREEPNKSFKPKKEKRRR